MPKLDKLIQPMEFMVPTEDRSIVYQCCLKAVGHPVKMDYDQNGAVFTFHSVMEMRAAETLIREVFELEIRHARDGQWVEWRAE